MFSPCCIILRITDLRANSVDPDEVAHNEPPHLDLHCLQIQIFSFLEFKAFKFKLDRCSLFTIGKTYKDSMKNIVFF